MNALFNTQPPALQAEKLPEGETHSPFEKLAGAMGLLEKRQGTSGWMHPFWLLCFVFIALHTAQARIPEAMMDAKPEWFMETEGQRVVENVLSWQTSAGSWPKNVDTASEPFQGSLSELRGTFDNAATTGEMRFLIRAYAVTSDVVIRKAFLKALHLLLEAQYPSGGWPQTFPLEKGYSSHITFNDNTMVHILRLLREVSQWESSNLVTKDHQRSCQKAFERGIECILRSQIKVRGVLTVWCAQHDPVSLEPRPARSYELESLSGGESANILQLLMELGQPTPAVVRAINAGAAWYEASKIYGIRLVRDPEQGRLAVADPDAPVLWARFYELGTQRPFFCDRDGVRKYDFNQIGKERRNGYSWYGSYGHDVLKAYAEWSQRH